MLLIVGSGPMLPQLHERVSHWQLGEQTVFQPATSDVRTWLREIDIFVLPSTSEALSNSLMEAMASGCCPVASNVGGNPELVLDGQTGLLFKPGNAADLANQLRLLITRETMRKQLADAAAAYIRQEFPKQAAVRRMEQLYRDFLRRKTVLSTPLVDRLPGTQR